MTDNPIDKEANDYLVSQNKNLMAKVSEKFIANGGKLIVSNNDLREDLKICRITLMPESDKKIEVKTNLYSARHIKTKDSNG
jgi:hypothetical protein